MDEHIADIQQRTSSKILSYYFQTQNLKHTLLNATKIIKTDSTGINASVNWDDTICQMHKTQYTSPILTQGFIASFSKNKKFQITCLGREGSDYSAAIFGRIFNVEEVILFKDVDGLYSSDPKKNKKAKLYSELTYDKAFKLCNNRNTVIHPKTISVLQDKNIPLLIRNFNRIKQREGTIIK